MLSADTQMHFSKFSKQFTVRKIILNAGCGKFENDPPTKFTDTDAKNKVMGYKTLWESYLKYRKEVDKVMQKV